MMEKPALLLVNGLLQTQESWRFHAKVLGRRANVVTFDFPVRVDFRNMTEYGDAVLEELARRNLSPASTVAFGFSSGANVLRHLHCIREIPFRGLFLAACNPGGLGAFYEEVYGCYRDLLREHGLGAFLRAFCPAALGPSFVQNHKGAVAEMRRSVGEKYANDVAVLETLLAMPFNEPTFDTPPHVFRCPLVLMWGREDFLVPYSFAGPYAARCVAPGLESWTFEAGHAFPFEQPQAVVGRLLDHMQRWSPGEVSHA